MQDGRRECEQVAARLGGSIQPHALLHALMPLPDAPCMECQARLPRPGAGLLSLPGSAPAAATAPKTKRQGSKKGRSGGAARKP